MSCNLPVQNGIRDAADCKCYGAVMRTYTSMNDEPHQVALDAALRVYRYHHPEDAKKDAYLTVENWVSANLRH